MNVIKIVCPYTQQIYVIRFLKNVIPTSIDFPSALKVNFRN